MDKELVNYIANNYRHLYNEQESKAFRHIHIMAKYCNPPSETRLTLLKEKGWISENPEVLFLSKLGYEILIKKVTKRLYTEQMNDMFINYCPRCNKLARTPKAKQCPHCFLKWHHL